MSRGDEEGQRVDVEREVDPVGVEEARTSRASDAGEQRQQRRTPAAAATGVIPYVVTRLTWFADSSWSLADQVGDRGLLRRDPEQADALDEEGRHEQPPQLRRPAGSTANSTKREDVRDDHHLAPVEAVGERARDRPEDDRRQQADDEDAAEREVGRRVAVGELRSERRGRQQAEPVAEAGERHDQPQPPEVADPQDRPRSSASSRDQRSGRRPAGSSVGVDPRRSPGLDRRRSQSSPFVRPTVSGASPTEPGTPSQLGLRRSPGVASSRPDPQPSNPDQHGP